MKTMMMSLLVYRKGSHCSKTIAAVNNIQQTNSKFHSMKNMQLLITHKWNWPETYECVVIATCTSVFCTAAALYFFPATQRSSRVRIRSFLWALLPQTWTDYHEIWHTGTWTASVMTHIMGQLWLRLVKGQIWAKTSNAIILWTP